MVTCVAVRDTGVRAFRIDTSQAPELLRLTVIGSWPSAEELAGMREDLIPVGHLTAG
jgi:hypothetical protein